MPTHFEQRVVLYGTALGVLFACSEVPTLRSRSWPSFVNLLRELDYRAVSFHRSLSMAFFKSLLWHERHLTVRGGHLDLHA